MKKLFLIAPVLVLAACSQPQDKADTASTDDATAAAQPAETPTPGSSERTAETTHSAKLTAEQAKGEMGARKLLLDFGAAMKSRDLDRAYRMFGENGPMSGQTAAQWSKPYADYSDIAVEFGDGRVEGAAGSLYYQVPITLTATSPDGAVSKDGTITLRRVNDVPGATAEQLRWHIENIDW